MAILMSGQVDDALAPASAVSISAFPFTISRWVYLPDRLTIYSNRVQLIWYNSSNPTFFYVELACSAGTDPQATPRTERMAGGSVSYTPIATDGMYEETATHICEVFNAADDVELWVNGSLVDTGTVSRNFFASGNVLDDLFIGGKDPDAVNEPCFSGYLQDIAIWDGVALGSTEITQLQSYWSDTIPTAPDWSWRLSSDINANSGGINLTDVGTSSYSIETDFASLSSYSAPSSGVAGIILGGAPYSAPSALSATYTILNESGAAVSSGQQWMLNAHFTEGDIPSGSHVVLKYGGTELTTYQQSISIPHNGDGSLRSARFWVELPAGISDNSSLDLTMELGAGAPTTSTSISYTDVTGNSDLSISVVESGTTYYSDLNDLMASATIYEQGPMAVTWVAAERLHTSVPADHSRLYAWWCITWFSDDTYRVFVAIGNGVVLETHTDYTVTQVSLTDGVSTLLEETSISKVIPGGAWMPIVDTDGEPYWSGGFPDLTNQPDMDYAEESYMVPRMASTLESSVSAPTVPSYSFNDDGGTIWSNSNRAINQTGGNDWIGHFPLWSGEHLLSLYGSTGTKIRACDQYDRLNAIAWMTHPHANYDTNFNQSNFTSNLRTYSGLTARASVRTYDTEAWFTGSGNSWQDIGNAGHGPSPCFVPWFVTGDVWFAEDIRLCANCLAGAIYVPTREKTVGGATYYCHQDGSQERGTAWTSNHFLMAHLVTPTGHSTKDYFDDLVADQFTGLWKRATVAAASGGHLDSQKALGFVYPGTHTSDINWGSPWMQNYFHIVCLRAAMLGVGGADGCVDAYVKLYALAWANQARDRTAQYRVQYFKSDRFILDSVTEMHQDWADMWLGYDSANEVGSDCGYLNYSSGTGPFTVGETITGLSSTNTARVIADDGSKLTILGADLTNLSLGETVEGGTSGETATFDSRTFLGSPVIPNSSLKTGDPSVTDTPDTNDSQYFSIWMAVMALLGEYTTGTDQTNSKAHWDQWWSTGKSTYTVSGLATNYTQYRYKYSGATE